MGGDGGSIPHRSEMVRTKQKLERLERDIEMLAKWQLCQITQDPLREPIVACQLGRLFNKDAIIEGIINKTLLETENASHIRSIKDVKQLRFTANPSFDSKKIDKGDVYKDMNVAPFICPVVGLEMNGKHRFCFSWQCGCVVSERAVKEVPSHVCHKCGGVWNAEDVIVINANDEEVDSYRFKMEQSRIAEAKAKKARKEAKANKVTAETSTSINRGEGTSKAQTSTVKRKSDQGDTGDDSASGSKKVKSVQNDPSASSVFKKLFTSHEDAKNRPEAHWVTYNPQYY